jgi:hypothetical protein
MKYVIRSLGLLFALTCLSANAGQVDDGEIERLQFYANDLYIYIKDSTSGCGRSFVLQLGLDTNKQATKAVVAGLYAALHNKTKVHIVGSGNCHLPHWPDDEIVTANHIGFTMN